MICTTRTQNSASSLATEGGVLKVRCRASRKECRWNIASLVIPTVKVIPRPRYHPRFRNTSPQHLHRSARLPLYIVLVKSLANLHGRGFRLLYPHNQSETIYRAIELLIALRLMWITMLKVAWPNARAEVNVNHRKQPMARGFKWAILRDRIYVFSSIR